MRGNFLEVRGPTRLPKLGFDSNAGWFAYVMPHDQAFVKRFPSPKDGVYPEIAGLTLCFAITTAASSIPPDLSATRRGAVPGDFGYDRVGGGHRPICVPLPFVET
jgi:hypothetical protein